MHGRWKALSIAGLLAIGAVVYFFLLPKPHPLQLTSPTVGPGSAIQRIGNWRASDVFVNGDGRFGGTFELRYDPPRMPAEGSVDALFGQLIADVYTPCSGSGGCEAVGARPVPLGTWTPTTPIQRDGSGATFVLEGHYDLVPELTDPQLRVERVQLQLISIRLGGTQNSFGLWMGELLPDDPTQTLSIVLDAAPRAMGGRLELVTTPINPYIEWMQQGGVLPPLPTASPVPTRLWTYPEPSPQGYPAPQPSLGGYPAPMPTPTRVR